MGSCIRGPSTPARSTEQPWASYTELSARSSAAGQRDARSVGTGVGLQTYELVLELTYIFQATRWLQVKPDVQYVIKPGGTGKIPNALVIGFQLALNL